MPVRIVRSQAAIAGHREAIAIAATLGGAVRATRRTRRWTLHTLAGKVGVSRARLSEIERGSGATAPLETWVALGVALGRPLAATLTRPLGQGLHEHPRDAGHLEIQERLLAFASVTGRQGTFELPTRPPDPSRSTDVGLRDPVQRVRILAECWNTFGDLGAAARATRRKTAEAAAAWPDDRIATVWVVRGTSANRALLARFPHIVDAAFPGSSRAWVDALTTGSAPPEEPGLVWFDPATGRLTARRRVSMTARAASSRRGARAA